MTPTKKTEASLKFRVGTRDSALAMAQTNLVVDKLKKLNPSYEWEIVSMKTMGDKILQTSLSKIGEKALFTRELETGLTSGTLDLVVHSLKDLPTKLPDGLTIGAILEREEPGDAVVLPKDSPVKSIEELEKGAIIGTSSIRRIAQLRRKYPDFQFKSVRGNLNTRLRKLDEDKVCDALILAVAGLKRLDWGDRISEILPTTDCLYAVGQGAIAVECRLNDKIIAEILQELNHRETALRCIAERVFMKKLEGGCSVPLGVFSIFEGDVLLLEGGVFSFDGQDEIIRKRDIKFKEASEMGQGDDIVGVHCPKLKETEVRQAIELGEKLANELIAEGAAELLAKARKDASETQF